MKTGNPQKVTLIAGIMAQSEALITEAENRIEKHLGRLARRSPVYPFTFTTYYEEEMGADLVKRFVSVEPLFEPDRLAEVKTLTNAWEEERSAGEGAARHRTVNIDPGFLNLSKLMLATTKDFDHRLYLGRSIYAEVTLRYSSKAKSYVPLEWTYADYRTELALKFFNEVRERYREILEREGE